MGRAMSIPEAPPASPPPDEKRQPRQSRLVKAALACTRLGKFDVTIRNVSETGIGGQAPGALHIGERITVFLPGHEPMLGTVRWVAGTRFGIQTDRPVEVDAPARRAWQRRRACRTYRGVRDCAAADGAGAAPGAGAGECAAGAFRAQRVAEQAAVGGRAD